MHRKSAFLRKMSYLSSLRGIREEQEMKSCDLKPRIKYPVIVEGRYDKITLSSIFSGHFITTEGFSVFNSKEKQTLIRRIAERGIILLCDSDAGGRQIRSFLLGALPKEKIINLYIPEIEGKEKRKRAPSKSGRLGVEGMPREVLTKLLSPYTEQGEGLPAVTELTKRELYLDGLSGGEGAKEKRETLAKKLGLPREMSANALIEAINLTVGKEGYDAAMAELLASKNDEGSLC